MPLAADIVEKIEAFVARNGFAEAGAVVTDLDGTAVEQHGDRVYIPDSVAHGLDAVRRAGRPVIFDTLRFPLSIIATFGSEWVRLSRARLPVVCLNGSLCGTIGVAADGQLAFEEAAAFPLAASDIDELLVGIDGMLSAGADHIVLFIYSRDWRGGEVVWTPSAARIDNLRRRFVSASRIEAMPLATLAGWLHSRDICMLTLLHDRPDDDRLAFQHASPSRFVTATGIDKRTGADWLAQRLGVRLGASIGAGDTELDTFLAAVGLAIHVGTRDLAFRGGADTLRLATPEAFGEVLMDVARSCREGVRT